MGQGHFKSLGLLETWADGQLKHLQNQDRLQYSSSGHFEDQETDRPSGLDLQRQFESLWGAVRCLDVLDVVLWFLDSVF